MPELTARYRCETVCVSAFSGALREMVLAGLGLGWLPRSLARADIAAGRLAVLDPDRMRHPMAVALYARPPGDNASEVALWQYLAQIDLSGLIA